MPLIGLLEFTGTIHQVNVINDSRTKKKKVKVIADSVYGLSLLKDRAKEGRLPISDGKLAMNTTIPYEALTSLTQEEVDFTCDLMNATEKNTGQKYNYLVLKFVSKHQQKDNM
jgi:hypothetical protein